MPASIPQADGAALVSPCYQITIDVLEANNTLVTIQALDGGEYQARQHRSFATVASDYLHTSSQLHIDGELNNTERGLSPRFGVRDEKRFVITQRSGSGCEAIIRVLENERIIAKGHGVNHYEAIWDLQKEVSVRETQRCLNDQHQIRVDEEVYVFLAKAIIRTALCAYKKINRFFLHLEKDEGVCKAALYLEEGERLVEWAGRQEL
ncbi:hypothetical protein FB567DRAFT_594313 [Paraphoma chrysanthemicola]|uniref:Uncharacterized protein n=1 Tax=Paraphoma chrysanthemicola TaxID=798071 RepID=A0A8K0R4J3_9PLEO|nr:hypothetical protein FB567DRAFT_594313 [Paraphoma chrysanthemicola]